MATLRITNNQQLIASQLMIEMDPSNFAAALAQAYASLRKRQSAAPGLVWSNVKSAAAHIQ